MSSANAADAHRLTCCAAYTSAMFSETRYALNGDLRVAYRASREGPRDIVSIPNWFTCCEVLPEQPAIQGWVEAMTSLGRLIYFDQPGTGASDPVTPDALPTLEQWADSITAVLDDLGSSEAVLVAGNAAFAPAALFAATHPSRTTALVVLGGYADAGGTALARETLRDAVGPPLGRRGVPTCFKSGHAVERGDQGSVAGTGTPGGQPKDASSGDAFCDGSWTCGRSFRQSVCRLFVVQHPDRRDHPAREGRVHRRAHTRRQIR